MQARTLCALDEWEGYWGVKCRFLHDPERQGRLPRTCAIRGSATSKARAAGACGLLFGNGAALSKDASKGTEKEEEEEEEEAAEEDADEADATEEERGALALCTQRPASAGHRPRLWVHISLHPGDPGFHICRVIIGKKGTNVSCIHAVTGTKLRLRGRGSGHIEVGR